MNTLEGKVALVTGAGRGIGAAIAQRLAAAGARIVVNDLDTEPAVESVQSIIDAGGEALSSPGDVVDPATCQQLVDTAVDGFGGLDIIVNNAGYTWDNVIQKMSDEQWRAILDVHLTAPFQIMRAASGFIRSAAKQEKAEGREVFRKIVNISSTSGLNGNAGQANYSTAKAGIIGLTLAMSKEWGRYKVNVNCVAFGLIQTRLSQALHDQAANITVGDHEIPVGIHTDNLKMMDSIIPLGRAGTPQEAAGAVYMLCIPESNYVSGQVITCSGGLRT
jgi:3-oxoacyl-[acyl-carrier protein] reductase